MNLHKYSVATDEEYLNYIEVRGQNCKLTEKHFSINYWI